MWLWALAARRSRRGEPPDPEGEQERHCRQVTSLAGFLAFLVVFPIGRCELDAARLRPLRGLLGVCASGRTSCTDSPASHPRPGRLPRDRRLRLGAPRHRPRGRRSGSCIDLPNLPFLLTVVIAIAGRHAVQRADRHSRRCGCRARGLAFVTLAFNLLVFLVLQQRGSASQRLSGHHREAQRPRASSGST